MTFDFAGFPDAALAAIPRVDLGGWPTPLGRWATAAGAHAFGGLPMLVHQAVEQVRLMTGRQAPVDVMWQAAVAARAAGHGSSGIACHRRLRFPASPGGRSAHRRPDGRRPRAGGPCAARARRRGVPGVDRSPLTFDGPGGALLP